jgi:hypothetical protein
VSVVVIVADALALVAPDAVANLFLLAVALVFSDITLITSAVALVVALVGASAFLAAILSVIRICVRSNLAEAEQGGQRDGTKKFHIHID